MTNDKIQSIDVVLLCSWFHRKPLLIKCLSNLLGTKVSLYLPICYKNKIDGLCGDLGGNSGSLNSPDAKKASDWKVDPTCPEPPEGTVFDPCKVSFRQLRLHFLFFLWFLV